MTDVEILEKVIYKAIDNGFLVPKDVFNFVVCVYEDLSSNIIWDFYQEISPDSEYYEDLHEKDNKFTCEPFCCGTNKDKLYSLNDIIYNHDFAKAFWGEDIVCLNCGKPCKPYEHCCNDNNETLKAWEYHLREMVIQENPIKYLEKFL